MSGPTLPTGICFCAACGGALTQDREGSRYRYYTCSTKARQGETGCKGRSIPMAKLDDLVAHHLEERLLVPERLEEILAAVLDRRQERSERRRNHIGELNRRATEADARLKRLYDAIENGVADLDDPDLRERIASLKATRDQAQVDAERARATLQGSGQTITAAMLAKFARTAQRMRIDGGGYRRDRLPGPWRSALRLRIPKFGLWDRRAICSGLWLPPEAGKLPRLAFAVRYWIGGQGGIRTHDTLAGTPHFECGTFNHSATCPPAVIFEPKPDGKSRQTSARSGC